MDQHDNQTHPLLGAALCICLSPSSSTSSGKNKYILFLEQDTLVVVLSCSENMREKNELFDDNQNCA